MLASEEQIRAALNRLDLLLRLESTVTLLEMRTFAERVAGGAVPYAAALKALREQAIAAAVEGLLLMDSDFTRTPTCADAG